MDEADDIQLFPAHGAGTPTQDSPRAEERQAEKREMKKPAGAYGAQRPPVFKTDPIYVANCIRTFECEGRYDCRSSCAAVGETLSQDHTFGLVVRCPPRPQTEMGPLRNSARRRFRR